MYIHPILQKALPGNEWLGAVRRAIQRKFRNGSDVVWESVDTLQPEPRVIDIEEIAQDASSATIIAYQERLLNKRYISEHFMVIWEENSDIPRGQIYYTPEQRYGVATIELANFWQEKHNSKHLNKWVFNRGSPCIALDYHPAEPYFQTVQSLLLYLEADFPRERYDHYLLEQEIRRETQASNRFCFRTL
jgi:hypothetical protein